MVYINQSSLLNTHKLFRQSHLLPSLRSYPFSSTVTSTQFANVSGQNNDQSCKNSAAQKARETFKRAVCGYSHIRYESTLLTHPQKTKTERLLHLSKMYIEAQCTSKYGFLTYVSSKPDLGDSTTAIPNTFDTSLVIEILNDAGISLSSCVKNTASRLLLENLDKESGLWNYFLSNYSLIPCDVDASSCAIAALISLGLKAEIVETMAKNILQKATFHEDGLIDVYFRKDFSRTKDINLQIWPVVRRIDLGVTANFLFLQTKIGNQSDKLIPSYHLINRAIKAILLDELTDTVIIKYAKNYTNLDFIVYLISRIVGNSSLICKSTLAKVVQKRLDLDTPNPVSIASRILAGINCGLHENESTHIKLGEQVHSLMKMQNSDYSFSEVEIYNAHNQYFFGSRALSTSLGTAAISQASKMITDFK